MGSVKEFYEAEILALAMERSRTAAPSVAAKSNLKPVTETEYWEAVLAQKSKATHA